MKPSFRHAILCVALLAGTSASHGADPVIEQIENARKAYESGELRTAVDTLNAAVTQIQEQMTERLLALLPEPIEGWQADAAESQAGGMAAMITGTSISRRYVRDDGAEVTLNLMADSPMMPMLTMALSMPFVMQANPAMKSYSLGPHRGMLEHEAGTDDYEVTVMVGNRLVLQATGSGIADPGPLEQYLQALDLDAIQNALPN